jgi:hypothetical protein
VEKVDWYSALAYANWLSSQNGLQQCYTLSGCSDSSTGWHDGAHSGCTGATFTGLGCTGYRLLTESEWERAARGGTTSTYYWGEATDTTTVGQYAWFSDNSGGRTQPVGQKVMNAYGLYDMGGNVYEMVWDWVYTSSAWIPYPSGSATDYLGGSSGSGRGLRGGSWFNSASFLRSAFRGNGFFPSFRDYDLGVRLARTVPIEDAGCPPPTEACVTGTQNRRGCGNARTLDRSAAGTGVVINDSTCSARNDLDDSTTCFDAGYDHTYRIYMRQGESMEVRLQTLTGCATASWLGTLKIFETAGCDSLLCSTKVYCEDQSDDLSDTYVAPRDGWVIVVVDGSTAFDDEGTYRLTVNLTCASGNCQCE